MKAQSDHSTDHFRVGGNAQNRIKLPGVFWAGVKAIDLQPDVLLRHSGLPLTVYSGESLVTTAQHFAHWRSIRALSSEQIREVKLAIRQQCAESWGTRLVKELERMKKKLSVKLATLSANHRKDNTLIF